MHLRWTALIYHPNTQNETIRDCTAPPRNSLGAGRPGHEGVEPIVPAHPIAASGAGSFRTTMKGRTGGLESEGGPEGLVLRHPQFPDVGLTIYTTTRRRVDPVI